MLSSFFFSFTTFFQPGIFWPELAPFRPMQVIAVFAVLFSMTARPTFDRGAVLRHPAVKAVFALVLVQAISVYRSGLGAILSEFLFWSNCILFVSVSLWVITDSRALKRYVWGMICGSLWIVAWGLWAVHEGTETQNGGRAGAYGMYENHNDYSFIIVQVLPFIYVFWRSSKGLIRWSLLVAMLACVAGMGLSLSRGGMIALVLEFALIVMLTMSRRQRWVLLPVVALLGAGAISYQYIKRAENQGDSYTAEDAETSRQELWRAGYTMIKTNPLLGVGSRTFGEQAQSYGEISHDNLGKNSHNTYIELAATSGLLGLFFFLRMVWCCLKELRGPPPGPGDDWEIQLRQATLIALLTICFRALFDAKSWDWSFYVLVVVSTAGGALLRSRAKAVAPAASVAVLEPAGVGSAGVASGSKRPLPPTNHLSPDNASSDRRPPAGDEADADRRPKTNHLSARS